jgi:hypothetical protein
MVKCRKVYQDFGPPKEAGAAIFTYYSAKTSYIEVYKADFKLTLVKLDKESCFILKMWQYIKRK